MRDELRAVYHDLASGRITESFTVAPHHLNSSNPVARAVRWFRHVTGTDSSSVSPSSPVHVSHSVADASITDLGERDKKTLAILPFRNLVNDPAFQFYEFSLADAVITELARLRSLVVRPSSLIAKYQGKNVDPREAGREMNVGSILAAAFIHAGERFRVTAQLIDVLSGDILWSERIDATSADIIALQDTIAQKIVEGLRIELTPSEQVEIERKPTDSAEAYEEYLRGRDSFARFIFRTAAQKDCDQAIEHFKRAIELDTNFALAHDGLGACHVNRVFKGLGSAEDFEKAEEAFGRALAIDPDLTEARMLMVFVYLWRGEKQKARDEVEQMRKERPNEAVVYFVKATLHRLDGEADRALRSLDKLVRLDPAAHVVAHYNRALIYIFLGRLTDAHRELDQASESEPDNPLVKLFRALTLYYQHEVDAATEILRAVASEKPEMHGLRPFLAMCLSAQGKHEEALAQITDAVKRNAEVDPDIAYGLASLFALENMNDEALDWLSHSMRMGNANRRLFLHDPNLKSLRSDPRFDAMMANPGN
jgi:serine/threonine-protein kinase